MDKGVQQAHPQIAKYVKRLQRFNEQIGNNTRVTGYINRIMYPHNRHCSSSDITAMGAFQALILGDHLRHKYLDPGQLKTTDVLARFTHHKRTLINLMAVLHTLLPNVNLMDVKYKKHHSPTFCDAKMSGFRSCHCQLKHLLFEKYYQYSHRYHSNSTNDFFKLAAHIGDIFGLPQLTDVGHPWPFLDIMMVATCHNVSYCNKTTDVCLTDNVMQQLWDTYDTARTYWNDPNQLLKKWRVIMNIPMMTEIVKRIKLVTKIEAKIVKHKGTVNETKYAKMLREIPKFVLYSGHGDTVAAALELLGIYSQRWPPFMGRIVIEAYTHIPTSKILVKFIYNGDDMTDRVPFCMGNIRVVDNNRLCRIEAFHQYIINDVYKLYNASSFREACDNVKPYENL